MDTSITPENSERNDSDSLNEIFENSLVNYDEVEELDNEKCDFLNESYRSHTFENTLLAKKRLQAYSFEKTLSITSSSTKDSEILNMGERSYHENGELEENSVALRKPPKIAENSMVQVNAAIEEIEYLKKTESLESMHGEDNLSYKSDLRRSRSKSSEKEFVFKKREKKIRNYRRSDNTRRSLSPVLTKTKNRLPEKSTKHKYPRNWNEFVKDKWTFERLARSSLGNRGNKTEFNDLGKQLLFEIPSEQLKTYHYKNEKGEEILVPIRLLRYTSTKPKVPYNVNLVHFKEYHLNREQILNKTNKNFRAILEKFLSRTSRAKSRTSGPMGQRNWYSRSWKDSESKIVENSIGLSFLQTYSDEDEEEEEEFNLDVLPKHKELKSKTGNNTSVNKELFQYLPEKFTHESYDEKLSFDEFLSREISSQRKNFGCRELDTIISPQRDELDVKKAHKNTSTGKVKEKIRELQHSPNLRSSESEISKFKTSEASRSPLLRKYKSKKTKQSEEISRKNEKQSLSPISERFSRNRTKSETLTEDGKDGYEDMGMSWTPDRTILNDSSWEETPKSKRETMKIKEKKGVDANKFDIEQEQKPRELYSDDEWDDETPPQTVDKSFSEEDVKKAKKKVRKKKNSESNSDDKKTKKKKKIERRKKQKEKERKAKKKKERLKAEKLRLKKEKKKKQREKQREHTEKAILKQLKKEIEQSLEEVEKEDMQNNEMEIEETPVVVKIEKDDDEKLVRPSDDLRNFLDKKVGKVRDLREKVQKNRSSKKKKRHSDEYLEKTKAEISKQEFETMEIEFKSNVLKMEKQKENESDNEKKISIEGIVKMDERISCGKTNIILSPLVDSKIEVQEHLTPELPKPLVGNLKSESVANSEDVHQGTPDTEEYHSNWESDDNSSPIVKKADRSWESDEELFEGPYPKTDVKKAEYSRSTVLQMPLHIDKFPKRGKRVESKSSRSRSRTRTPEYIDVNNEMKLLEEERKNLSKERMRLEIERMRIQELERKKSMEEIDYLTEEILSPSWNDLSRSSQELDNKKKTRWDMREDFVDSSTPKRDKLRHDEKGSTKKDHETTQSTDNSSKLGESFSSNSAMSISSSPEITSTKSPTPTLLESAYQEFMKAVSVGDDSKDFLVISSTDSDHIDPSASDGTKIPKKTRLSRSERDKNSRRGAADAKAKDDKKLLNVARTTDPIVLQEILLPGEVPISEIPMPTPTPITAPAVMTTTPMLTHTAMLTHHTAMSTQPRILTPMPVPSPIVDAQSYTSMVALSINSPIPLALNENSSSALHEKDLPGEEYPIDRTNEEVEEPAVKKPFSFSTLVLSSKKLPLLEKSKWKLDDDSDEEGPPTKTYHDIKNDHEESDRFMEHHGDFAENLKETKETEKNTLVTGRPGTPVTEKDAKKCEKIKDVKDREKDKRSDHGEKKKEDERSSKRRHSRSRSPVGSSREKRRKEEEYARDKKKRDDTKREDVKSRLDSRRREDDKRRSDDAKRKDDDVKKREEDSKRRKRPASPQRVRDPSPRRRRLSSPTRRKSPARHRSPPRRQETARRPERSGRRSSPRRRRSYSPISRQDMTSRRRSVSPRDKSPRYSHHQTTRRSKSPIHSPMDGLKRSVADSTISDDMLPQPYAIECSNSPLNSSSAQMPMNRRSKVNLSPKRPSLDERINQVLGIETTSNDWKSSEPHEFGEQNMMEYPIYHEQSMVPSMPFTPSTTPKVLQVGNILQVVPTEDIALPPTPVQPPQLQKIVQVGNMLQIVPTEIETVLPPFPPRSPPPPPPQQQTDVPPTIGDEASTAPTKQSIDAILAAKRAERMKKKQEKEDRKKEKEKRKKEKEKRRKMRIKTSTEEIIKRALELDGLIENEEDDLNIAVPEIVNDLPGLDPSKSILSSSLNRCPEMSKTDKRKSVQFADGVRPGEGTSPSGGEELSSPPPQSEVVPKTKKFKKIDSSKRKKRKIKVKVIKKRPVTLPDSDDEYENLPPPSPPPGSPPPYVFPPRMKVHTINNIPQHYLPAYGLTTAPQQQQPPLLGHHVMNIGAPAYRPPPPPPTSSTMGQPYGRSGQPPPLPPIGMGAPQQMHAHAAGVLTHPQPYGSY